MGQLFGLWGQGTSLVDKLTNAFKGKNQALGDQQGEYAKEYSWLKQLAPSFLTSAISVTALSSALGDLKNNPIELPSLQPVTDMETAFDTAKNKVNESMEGVKQSVAEKLPEAVKVIQENSMTAGDTIIEANDKAKDKVEKTTEAIKKNLTTSSTEATQVIDTSVQTAGDTITTGIESQEKTMDEGFTNMEEGAENLSVSIQKSFATFISKTGENISKWITSVINPAIALMEAMNLASGYAMYSVGGAKKAIKDLKKGVEGLDKNIGQPVKNAVEKAFKFTGKLVEIGASTIGDYVSSRGEVYDRLKTNLPEIFPDWSTTAKTIVSGIGVGSGIGLAYSATTGDTSWLEQLAQLVPSLAVGGVLTSPTLAMVGEYSGASSNPEIVTPQSLLYETNMKANVPVMNAIEEMGDKVVGALNNMGVYAEFDYSKLKVGIDNENYRTGGKLYGI